MTAAQEISHDPDALTQARRFLTRAGLQSGDADGRWYPLAGGVSSDLWRVDLPDRTVCVKGALEKLRVADEWHAPVNRNAVEYAWLEFVGAVHPDNVPQLYAHDGTAGFFAMEYLRPQDHPVWKAQLFSGFVDADFAAQVGALLGAVHADSAVASGVPQQFATDENFAALRLDPYFRVTARRNPDVADVLEALALRTATTKVALVHGDVSPKNILVGPRGPVLLDAECAWFGDPAFDLAFCTTHLLLKMLVVGPPPGALLQSGRALIDAHTAKVSWEDQTALSRRVATLLPALVLARVDGASPVEYLTDPARREFVRSTAVDMLRHPAASPLDVVEDWYSRCGIGD